MRDCHLKNTCDRVVATCGLMPRLIPPGSLNCIFFLKAHTYYVLSGYTFFKGNTM